MIAAALAALMVVGGSWWYSHRAALSSVPSIAVMPFEVAGGDAATDRLTRGIANDISIDFSRLRNLDVIGSSTTEAYGSRGADVRRIARDLNVRYVLTGAIQREGDQFRVSALLQDGATGAAFGRIDGIAPAPISSRCRTKSPTASSPRSGAGAC